MKLLKGKGKSTIVDISDKELNAMFESFVADIQMSNALVNLDDTTFEENVTIPKKETVKIVRDKIKSKIKIIEPIVIELSTKMMNQ